MQNFKIGDRVLTPHGKGRIKAFTAWSIDGDEVYITEHIGNNRLIIKLDKDHTWCFKHTDYCPFPDEVEVIYD